MHQWSLELNRRRQELGRGIESTARTSAGSRNWIYDANQNPQNREKEKCERKFAHFGTWCERRLPGIVRAHIFALFPRTTFVGVCSSPERDCMCSRDSRARLSLCGNKSSPRDNFWDGKSSALCYASVPENLRSVGVSSGRCRTFVTGLLLFYSSSTVGLCSKVSESAFHCEDDM